MRKISVIFITILFINSTYSTDYSKLNQYFDSIAGNKKAMGSVVLIKNGKAEFERHFGFIKEISNPIYRIGSISKVFTATIILKLIEEGKLKLDTKLSDFYQDIKNADEITIEHLLRHRTGLPNLTGDPSYQTYFEKGITENDQLQRIINYPSKFKPGSKYEYSNTNYILLSYIAENITGKPFQEILNHYITKPLKLKNTYVFKQAKPNASEVSSYEKNGPWEKSSNTHESVPLGAGAIVSTPEELATFIRSLLNGKLVSEAHLKMMKKQIDSYGLGLITFPYGENTFYGHTGGIDGFRSIVGHNKKDDLVMVQFTNALNMSFNDISLALLDAFYDNTVKIPQFTKKTHSSREYT